MQKMHPHSGLVDTLKMSFTVHLDWLDAVHLMLVHMSSSGEEYAYPPIETTKHLHRYYYYIHPSIAPVFTHAVYMMHVCESNQKYTNHLDEKEATAS